MIIVCIRSYLKSISKRKFLLSDTYRPVTLCLREQDERIRGYFSKPQAGPRAQHFAEHSTTALRRDTLYRNATRSVNKYGNCGLKCTVWRTAPTVTSLTLAWQFVQATSAPLPEDLTGFGHRHVIPAGQTRLIFPWQRTHKDLQRNLSYTHSLTYFVSTYVVWPHTQRINPTAKIRKRDAERVFQLLNSCSALAETPQWNSEPKRRSRIWGFSRNWAIGEGRHCYGIKRGTWTHWSRQRSVCGRWFKGVAISNN
jgi:hypothetical protein